LNGKVERSHCVDAQECYQLLDQDGITDDIHLFNAKLREWEDYYNYHRPRTDKRRSSGSWQKRELTSYRGSKTVSGIARPVSRSIAASRGALAASVRVQPAFGGCSSIVASGL
jgi:hypothetical protein